MSVKELITALKKCPQDLPIRYVDNPDEENIWITEIELSETGECGYEFCGEIRLIGSE